MTYLELIAAIGTVPMDMAHMYFNGKLTGKELKNVIGKKKAGLVENFESQYEEKGCTSTEDCCNKEKNLENSEPTPFSRFLPAKGVMPARSEPARGYRNRF